MAIKNYRVEKALRYLDDVISHKQIVPFFKFNHGVGRHAQAKNFGTSQGRWPEKSVRLVIDVLKQAASNAKALHQKDLSELYVESVNINRATGRRRRTYRAHGRVNKFESQPCHLEIIVAPKGKDVEKPKALAE